MDKEKIEEKIIDDDKKIAQLEATGLKGLSHLLEYLKMRDDKDFLDLSGDIENLLNALYKLSVEEGKMLKNLGFSERKKKAEIMAKAIDNLKRHLSVDEELIRQKKEVDLEGLYNLISIFENKVGDFLRGR